MKKLLYLLPLVILFSHCKKEDAADQQQPVDGDGGVIFTSQIVQIEVDELLSDTYQGDINGTPVTLGRGNENTLVFVVTSELPLGEATLNVAGLDLEINYNIQQTVLESSVEETMQTYVSSLQTALNDIEDSVQRDKAQEIVSGINGYYQTWSNEEKQLVAEYYQANKALLQSAIDGRFERLANSGLSNFTRCKSGIYLTGILGATTALLAKTGVGAKIALITGGVTAITLAKTIQHCSRAAISAIKSVFLKAEEYLAEAEKTQSTSIEMNNEITKTIPIVLANRALQTSDSGDENEYISGLFIWLNELNTKVIDKLNEVINTWNNTAPSFFSVDPYQRLNVNSNSPAQELALTQELFDNISFSVASNNVEIESLSFVSGGIDLKLKIIDLTIVTNGYVATTLDFTYTDEFNDFSGSFPLKVYEDIDSIPIYEAAVVGGWTVTNLSDGSQRILRLDQGGLGRYIVLGPNGPNRDGVDSDGNSFYNINWEVVKTNGKYHLREDGFWHYGFESNRTLDTTLPENFLTYPVTTFLTYTDFGSGASAGRRYTKD